MHLPYNMWLGSGIPGYCIPYTGTRTHTHAYSHGAVDRRAPLPPLGRCILSKDFFLFPFALFRFSSFFGTQHRPRARTTTTTTTLFHTVWMQYIASIMWRHATMYTYVCLLPEPGLGSNFLAGWLVGEVGGLGHTASPSPPPPVAPWTPACRVRACMFWSTRYCCHWHFFFGTAVAAGMGWLGWRSAPTNKFIREILSFIQLGVCAWTEARTCKQTARNSSGGTRARTQIVHACTHAHTHSTAVRCGAYKFCVSRRGRRPRGTSKHTATYTCSPPNERERETLGPEEICRRASECDAGQSRAPHPPQASISVHVATMSGYGFQLKLCNLIMNAN